MFKLFIVDAHRRTSEKISFVHILPFFDWLV